jgi:hypothetical protein
MSKTWKTRPLMVRINDKEDKAVDAVENHDHSEFECSLPDSPVAQLKLTHEQWRALNCRYDWGYSGHNLCGCPMCTDRWGKESKKKERRQEGRKLAQQKDY